MLSPQLEARYTEIYGSRGVTFAAPGRVNLIGEHTDYNDGWVMPCAIGFSAHVAIAPRSDSRLLLRSEEFPQKFEFEVERLPTVRTGSWCDYLLGIAQEFQQRGHSLPGANVLVSSQVPVGAGLSSSAALEVATAFALMSLLGVSLPRPEIAKLCQHAENTFVGARVGIMDQFVACLGKAGHALVLDCRSLEYQLVPVPRGVRIVICNTMVKHELSGGEYNRRREECDAGVKLLARWYPGIRALRDVSLAQLEAHRGEMPPLIYQRCLHVVAENQRVMDAVKALGSNDLSRFGELMAGSHRSLRDLYQVSCPELDIMVGLAKDLAGCYGARMTGGGFGGCTVNLVRDTDADAFSAKIAAAYKQKTGIHPDVYICTAADGAHAES